MLLKTTTFLLSLMLISCTSKIATDETKVEQTNNKYVNSSLESSESFAKEKNIEQIKWTMAEDSEWYTLYHRLKKNGIYGEDIDDYFKKLEGQFSQKPMGIKIQELYRNSFAKKQTVTKPVKDTSPNDTGVSRPWFKGFVTKANAQKCRVFIDANLEAFNYVEEKYNIPAEVISALISVETRHGDYLGEHNPLINLASMANSTKIEQIPNYIKDLPLAKEKTAWILKKMDEKSNWSYKELESLLIYCKENMIDPFTLPSSVYGALGYGQFMPTNIPIYAVDGDNDGIINLFQPADGIASTANFLYKHGWKKTNLTLSQKIKVLKRYNYSTKYANTIMALSVMTKRIK